MTTRLIIQFSAWNENGTKTEKKYLILNIEGDITMEIVNTEIEKEGKLSPFRSKKDIEIYYMQAF